MRAPCHVGEGLVDGDALDGRCEIAQYCDGGVAKALVFIEMSADKNEVGTELPRAPSRHAASYAEGPRFVGGRENDAASHRNRLVAQARVKQLFDRRIKGVEVRVEDGGCGTHIVAADSSGRKDRKSKRFWQGKRHSKALSALSKVARRIVVFLGARVSDSMMSRCCRLKTFSPNCP